MSVSEALAANASVFGVVAIILWIAASERHATKHQRESREGWAWAFLIASVAGFVAAIWSNL